MAVEVMKFEYHPTRIEELKEWMGDSLGRVVKSRHPDAKAEAEIKTLEDGSDTLTVRHIATEGDYIIKGFAGEFWAVKPDIFKETYESI